MKRTWIACLLGTCIALSYGCATDPHATGVHGTPKGLRQAQQSVQKALDALDARVEQAASQLSRTGLGGEDARGILVELGKDQPYVVDCCTIDASGTIVAIEPVNRRGGEGKNVGGQEHVRLLLSTGKPVLSTVFVPVETNRPSAALQWPIVQDGGQIMGCVSVLFEPAAFLDEQIRPLLKGQNWSCWAMQKDSRILYDPDLVEVGRFVFTDPLYSQWRDLVDLAKVMSERSSGSGSYRFLAGGMDRPTTKRCHWQTVSLHAQEWRVVQTYE